MDNNIKDNELFINPYNFVPVNFNVDFDTDNRKIRKSITDTKDTISGVISCSLKTKTPLCIPDAFD